MKVIGPSDKALKHKQLVTLGVGMDDKAVHVTTDSSEVPSIVHSPVLTSDIFSI